MRGGGGSADANKTLERVVGSSSGTEVGVTHSVKVEEGVFMSGSCKLRAR